MAGGPGGGRFCQLRCRVAALLPDSRTGGGAGRRGQSCLSCAAVFQVISSLFRDETEDLPRHFGPVRASDGTNTIALAIPRNGAILPPWIRGPFDQRMDPGAHGDGRRSWERGTKVADVGCGHGSSTIVMAQAFKNSTFTGFDYHPQSIQRARESATQASVASRDQFLRWRARRPTLAPMTWSLFSTACMTWEIRWAPPAHGLKDLAPDGVWMLVEPFTNDRGRGKSESYREGFFIAASTMICTPASLAQEVGLGLGAQAGEARLREVITRAGFSRFRRATQTPFNLVFEARL